VESVLDAAQAVRGPVYVRMLRGEIPRLFDSSQPMQLGRARMLSEGDDVTLLSSGICTEEPMRAQSALQRLGVSVRHLSVSTLKPFRDPKVLDALHRARYGVITLENHSILGGLGSAAAEMMAEAGIGKKLVRLGLKDTFAHGASRHYLMREYGLDALTLVREIGLLLGKPLPITEEDLARVQILPVHSDAKAEAL